MGSIFEALSRGERRRQQAEYLAYLKGRDGAPDRARRTLANREAFFRKLDTRPVAWEGEPVGAEFERLERGGMRPVAGVSALALWMAIVASSNEGEKYAVEAVLTSRPPTADPDDPMTYVELEEIYHTRLLLYALAALGVQYEVRRPPWSVRVIAWLLRRSPSAIESMVVFWAEVIGVVLFLALAERARELVDPESPA